MRLIVGDVARVDGGHLRELTRIELELSSRHGIDHRQRCWSSVRRRS